ncbi:hypothetical protein DB88DRAFT_475898 [Papiliotrema laurentii]|uniref:NADH:flavin oxidoreductase/NADH oxidase N-terminal domain-containing protein n=1 Tax=Papiliotrema laurentii TaxID=5418 RepID=A0AAD9L911_PAPLA|nr:hypothetical protein DB88DRAFT_475898 [Papiliotrema laurentii]
MSQASTDPLFTPWKVGNLQLKHRIVMAPLTRNRATPSTAAPNDLIGEYYEQRASDGGLLITEATYPSAEAGGYPNTPGLYTEEHVKEWKKVTDRVHAKGGAIFVQLWALGRANTGATGIKVVSSGDITDNSGSTGGAGGGDRQQPTPLSLEDIKRYQQSFAQSAKYAVQAGFDGIELHGAHGYLLDQFTQKSANNRTDEYGGSKENRARFVLETIKACADAIGEEKVAIRLSPYSHFQGMHNPDNIEVFTYLCEQIHKNHPNFGYVHMVESRADPAKLGNWAVASGHDDEAETLDVYRKVFEGSATAFLSAGGYTAEIAREVVKNKGGAVVFGRLFISNPDLPYRLRDGLELTPYDRSTFYTTGPEGYITYESISQPPTRPVSRGV